MIYCSSDLHFNHSREFVYKPRGFNNVEDMNNTIISNFNSVITPEDDLYLLGDLMLGQDLGAGLELLRQLNGRIHIVRGNHDSDRRWEAYRELPNVIEMAAAIYLHYRKYHFYLSHFPTLTSNLEKESLKQMTLNLFGHTHQKTNFHMDMPFMYHVGVDSHNCFPVNLDDIIEEMYDKAKECKEFLDDKPNQATQQIMIESTQKGNEPLFKPKCEKCVWQFTKCPGPSSSNPWKCPYGHTYKRDPPDGGYYG